MVERVQRTLREKFNKYFTFKNSYRYIDVFQKCFKAYNDTVHTSTGIAPSKVTDSDILNMEANECNSTSYTICKGQIALGQHVRISKYKLKFAKSSEQNFSTEIFRISNVY